MKGYDPTLDGPPAPTPDQTKEDHDAQVADVRHASGEDRIGHFVTPYDHLIDPRLQSMVDAQRVEDVAIRSALGIPLRLSGLIGPDRSESRSEARKGDK